VIEGILESYVMNYYVMIIVVEMDYVRMVLVIVDLAIVVELVQSMNVKISVVDMDHVRTRNAVVQKGSVVPNVNIDHICMEE